MPNRLSPGCCCGCDIFQADFDLRYMLPTIPATTTDWTTAQVRPNPGARRIGIPQNSIGEGLVFTQTVGGTITQANPRRQLFVPELTAHPDPAPIRALPGFALYVYRILPNEGGAAAGFYSLTPTTRTGPTTTRPVSMGVEIDWTTYWRRHFVLLDSAGVEVPGPDRFPFVLNPGERLESYVALPEKWFSINFFRLINSGWKSDPASMVRLSLIDDSGASRAAVTGTMIDVDGVMHTRIEIKRGDDTVHDLLVNSSTVGDLVNNGFGQQRYAYSSGAFLLWPNPSLWILFRDGHFDVSPFSSGRESGQSLFNTQPAIPEPWEFRESSVFQETGAVTVDFETSVPMRLRIELESSERRLATVSAERANGDRIVRTVDEDGTVSFEDVPINTDCPARKSNTALWPNHKPKIALKSLTIEGIDGSDAEVDMLGFYGNRSYFQLKDTDENSSLFLRWHSDAANEQRAFAPSIGRRGLTNVTELNRPSVVSYVSLRLSRHESKEVLLDVELFGNRMAATYGDDGSFSRTETVAVGDKGGGGNGFSPAWWTEQPPFAYHRWVNGSIVGLTAAAERLSLSPITIRWLRVIPAWDGNRMPDTVFSGMDSDGRFFGNPFEYTGDYNVIIPKTRELSVLPSTNPAFGPGFLDIITAGENMAINLRDIKLTIGGPDEL